MSNFNEASTEDLLECRKKRRRFLREVEFGEEIPVSATNPRLMEILQYLIVDTCQELLEIGSILQKRENQ